MSAWVKFNSTASDMGIVEEKGPGDDWQTRFSIDLVSGELRGTMFHNEAAGYDVESNFAPSTDTWYHVLSSYDGSNLKIYVNGEYQNQESASSATIIDTTNDRVRIGANTNHFSPPNPEESTDGQIDDVRIYNYALTEAQIKDVYTQGAAAFR